MIREVAPIVQALYKRKQLGPGALFHYASFLKRRPEGAAFWHVADSPRLASIIASFPSLPPSPDLLRNTVALPLLTIEEKHRKVVQLYNDIRERVKVEACMRSLLAFLESNLAHMRVASL